MDPLPSIVYIYSKWTYFQKKIIGLMKYSDLLRIGGLLLNVSQNHHN